MGPGPYNSSLGQASNRSGMGKAERKRVTEIRGENISRLGVRTPNQDEVYAMGSGLKWWPFTGLLPGGPTTQPNVEKLRRELEACGELGVKKA